MDIFPSALWHNHYVFGTDCRVLIKPIKDAERTRYLSTGGNKMCTNNKCHCACYYVIKQLN